MKVKSLYQQKTLARFKKEFNPSDALKDVQIFAHEVIFHWNNYVANAVVKLVVERSDNPELIQMYKESKEVYCDAKLPKSPSLIGGSDLVPLHETPL